MSSRSGDQPVADERLEGKPALVTDQRLEPARTGDGRLTDDRRAAGEQISDPDRRDARPDEVRGPPEFRTVATDPARRDDQAVGEWTASERTPVVAQDVPIEVVRERKFSFGQLASMLTGVALLASGITALVKTGIDRPLDQPVKSVLGWDHTPLLRPTADPATSGDRVRSRRRLAQ